MMSHGFNQLSHRAYENWLAKNPLPPPYKITENRRWFKQFGKSFDLTPGEKDAVQHCTVSCNLTTEIGENSAQVLGTVREITSPRNYTNPEDGRIDIHNNNVGSHIGGQVNDSVVLEPSSCLPVCMDALNNNNLRIP